jgi:RNA polymerase sigma factor (sigma-70 family)
VVTGDNDRLSRIETMWSVVRRAHGERNDEARVAQEQLLQRYGGAIKRYLLGALRDETAADEAYQEFALRFVKGDYAKADPDRGQFRSFLKTILTRLIIEHHRKRKHRKSIPLGSAIAEPAAVDDQDADEQFMQVWRDELLRRSWAALAESERMTGRPVHTVMDQRVANPELSSVELADRLSAQLDKTITTSNLRVMLHRARDQFAHLLLDEVRNTLDRPVRSDIEEELIELRLLKYCRPALERFSS